MEKLTVVDFRTKCHSFRIFASNVSEDGFRIFLCENAKTKIFILTLGGSVTVYARERNCVCVGA
jgi:hypothetical protein